MQLLSFLPLAAAAAALLPAATAVPSARAVTRCRVGEACFPSEAVLAAFNTTIGGRLFSESPISASCYKNHKAYNAAKCGELKQNGKDQIWITTQFAAYQQINWEGCTVQNECLRPTLLMPASQQCRQGRIAPLSVRAVNADDIKKWVQFVDRYNLETYIVNTGHDYKGRSSGKDAFALWTHNLKDMSFSTSFVPKGCSTAPRDALTFGAGVIWKEGYEFAAKNKRHVVGGSCGGVGVAGGWASGGGHSYLSPQLGLGVDNLLEADIVTPDGQLQTISECSNPDLFWAIRGGGGGTWGVVTRVAYVAHPEQTVEAVTAISTGVSLTSDQIETILADFAAISPKLADLGMGGIAIVADSGLVFNLLIAGAAPDTLKKALTPFFNKLISGSGISLTIPIYSNLKNFQEFYTKNLAVISEPVGVPVAVSSWLLARKYFETAPKGVARTIVDSLKVANENLKLPFVTQLLISGPNKDRHDPSKVSVTPAWQGTIWHAIQYRIYDDGAPLAERKEAFAKVHQSVEILKAFAPDGGAYQNEADVYQSDHVEAFWGSSNYARLSAIKAKIDPKSLYTVWQGVGWSGISNKKFGECYTELNPGVDVQ